MIDTNLGPKQAHRLDSFGDASVWLEFSPLANATNSVNLGQGFPGWQPPDFIKKAAQTAISDPNYFQYARSAGQPHLCQEIARQYSRSHHRSIDPNREILTTVGASEALLIAIMAYVNPGDEVILIEPFFDIYEGAVKMAGGVPVHLPLRNQEKMESAQDFYLDLDELKALLTTKTKALILNSPHNPTGKVFTTDEYKGIGEALAHHPQVVVISDEVYEHLVYDGHTHVPFATTEGMEDRTISIYSAGKTFSATGWKVGWVIAPSHLMNPMQVTQQWVVFAVANPLQEAVALCLEEALKPYQNFENYFAYLADSYEKKRNLLMAGLESSGFRPLKPMGSFFIIGSSDGADFQREQPPTGFFDLVESNGIMVDKSTLGDPSYNYCRHLSLNKGVTAIPTTAFYSSPHKNLGYSQIRFAFCKDDRDLNEAIARLKKKGKPS